MKENEKGKDIKEEIEKENEEQILRLFEESYPNYIHFNKKVLGKGGFNTVYGLTLSDSIAGAGKIIKFNKSDVKKDEIYYSGRLKGRNVVRKHAGFDASNGIDKYHLIVMENAQLSDLHKLFYHIKNKNLLNSIYFPFKNSENILRYFAIQLVNGLNTIRKYGYVHLDLKPKNFLVTNNLGIKITDYTIMKCTNDENDKIEKPGGTNGFIAPEYYEKPYLDKKNLNKYDIYGLGASLYNLKTGETFLNVDKNVTKSQIRSKLRQQYERSIKKLNSMVNDGISKEFVDLLKNMLKYNPEDRIDFEYIFRNKWINKYSYELEKIVEHYETEEEKAIMELEKSDVLLKYYEENKVENKKKFTVLCNKKKKYRRVK